MQPLIWSVRHIDSRVFCMSRSRPACKRVLILRAYAAKARKPSNQRGTQTVPLRSSLSHKMRPSICDQRGSKPRVAGGPAGHHPLIGQSILPLLLSSRRHLRSKPLYSSRSLLAPSQARGAQRAQEQLCSTPLRGGLFRQILNPRGVFAHGVCNAFCPCSLRSERSICAMRVVHHA